MNNRIVFINFWPRGGMRHYSDASVENFTRAYDVYYFTNYENSVPCAGHNVYDLTLNPFRLRNYAMLIAFCVDLVRTRPKAVHVNSGYPALFLIYPFFILFRSVFTVHDVVPHEGERRVKKIFHFFQLFLVSIFFRVIIVHSERMKNDFPFFVNRKKVHVVPHIHYSFLTRGAIQDRTKEGGRLSVLFFGRILKYKGLEYLVKAFEALHPNEYELRIAGEGVIDFDIKGRNISVINRFIEDREMVELFLWADVVAVPYISASQSGVVYLSFAFRRPVIATDVGSLPDVVQHGCNGLLVRPGDVRQLANALRQMHRKEFYESLRRNILTQNQNNGDLILQKFKEMYHAEV